MNYKKSFCVLIVFGMLAIPVEAQLAINNVITVHLTCRVQVENSTTNFSINTKTLLKLIADEQGFVLPENARLWLGDKEFDVLRQSGTIFTNISSDILSINYGLDAYDYKTHPKPKTFKSTIKGSKIITVNFNSASTSFTLNLYGDYNFLNEGFGKTAVATTKFSGMGFGPGTFDGLNMIVAGSFDGHYSFQYSLDGPPIGSFPPGYTNGVLGTFPH